MLVTKEQQEALLSKYIEEKHNQDQCIGFIDGMQSLLIFLSPKIIKNENISS